MIKVSMRLLLALLIGAGCHFFEVPVPGPPKLVVALLLVAMTTGYVAIGKLLAGNIRVLGKIEGTTQKYSGPPAEPSPVVLIR